MKTLKEWRKDKGYTRDHVARYLELKPNTFRFKEDGRRSFSVKEVQKLCELYDISIRDIDIC